MIEISGNFWEFPANFYCITTNGVVNNKGCNIMGAGIAKQARDKFPGIDFDIGFSIKEKGNHVFIVRKANWKWEDKSIVTFPTKHHWRYKSDKNLIKSSSEELKSLAELFNYHKFVLTWPGTLNGGLTKEEVRVIIEPVLPDNVFVIDWKQ